MTTKAKAFFPAARTHSDFSKYLNPVEASKRIKTLIDGKAIYSDMEREIAKAKKAVLIAFWALDPTLKLQTKQARMGGSKNWLDFLLTTAKRGVFVRLLMADFDPLLQNESHALAWLRYRLYVTGAKNLGLKRDQFQVVVARHEATIPRATTKLFGMTGLDAQLAKRLNGLADRERALRFANSPGMWAALGWDPKTSNVRVKAANAAHPAYPATHHEKLIWIDGRLAYVGGVNLITANLDTPKHLKKKLPWHDSFVRVQGAPLKDIRRHYVGHWNAQRKSMEAFLKAANSVGKPASMPASKTDTLTEKQLVIPKGKIRGRPIPGQLHRTTSKDGSSSVPTVVRKDVMDGYLKAISVATQYIYLENQYLRAHELADALIAQHKKEKLLKTIIVLPQVAEELMKKSGDPISLHGAHLQHEIIKRLQAALGKNLGIFSLATNKQQIYVHSKLLIVDDVYANIGSANANPRSFKMDTELGFAWYDKSSARALRLKLWRELLGARPGMQKWRPAQFVTYWSVIARRNAAAKSKLRKGFVVPFSNTTTGKKLPFIPDEFAALLTASDTVG